MMRITLLWFSAYLAALLFDRDLWVVSPYGLAESLCWLLILSLLVSVPAVRAFVGGLPRAQRAFCAVAIGALLFGQFTGIRPKRTFPLVPWRMRSATYIRPPAVWSEPDRRVCYSAFCSPGRAYP